MDEGYIKFQPIWTLTPALPTSLVSELSYWRNELYHLGLIGAYPDGVGFGNISQRLGSSEQFIITGSATGHLPVLGSEHFTNVTAFDVVANTVHCEGPIVASSESMSHAVIYQTCTEVQGVIHVHHASLWERLLHQVPTTVAGATYGSPEMANSIVNLLKDSDLRSKKIFVMQGHPEGIFTFGNSLAEAFEVLAHWLTKP